MASREELRRRAREDDEVVSEDDLEELIARAQQIQDEERGFDGVSRAELEAVAEELDIDPQFLERALEEKRRGGGREDRRAAREQRLEERRKARKRGSFLAWAGGLLIAGLAFALSLFFG